jgi:hypothetical protein
MTDPRVILILAILAGSYYVGEKAVAGIKVADRAICHVVTFGHKCKTVIVKKTTP